MAPPFGFVACSYGGGRSYPQIRPSSGFSLLELTVVVFLVGLLATLAAPPLSQMRTSASLSNAKYTITSVVSLARGTAMRHGRPTTFRIQPDSGVLWVEVDTSQTRNGQSPLVLGRVNLQAAYGVRLIANRTALCFDGRGIGFRSDECSATGAVFRVLRGEAEDSVLVTVTGRVVR